jgi:hypothetical protein
METGLPVRANGDGKVRGICGKSAHGGNIADEWQRNGAEESSRLV